MMSNCHKEIIDLLDDGFKSDQTIVGLSDIYAHLLGIFEKPFSSKVFLPSDIETLVNNQRVPYSRQGLLNWLNFYKPYQGSDKFINFLLKITKVNSRIVPWYESSNPTNTFDLTLDSFPKDLDLKKFINLINTYKNIEARLASMRTGYCPNRFTLDVSLLDYDILSDTSGVEIDGVTYCFGSKRPQQAFVPTPKVYQFLTSTISTEYLYSNWVILDEWIFGDRLIALINPDNNRVSYKTYTSKIVNHNNQDRTWNTGGCGWCVDKSWSSPYISTAGKDYKAVQSDYFRGHWYMYYTDNGAYVARTGSEIRTASYTQYVTNIANSLSNVDNRISITNGVTSLYPKWQIPQAHSAKHDNSYVYYVDISNNKPQVHLVVQERKWKFNITGNVTKNVKAHSFTQETSGYRGKVKMIRLTWKTGGRWSKYITWESSVVNCFTVKKQ